MVLKVVACSGSGRCGEIWEGTAPLNEPLNEAGIDSVVDSVRLLGVIVSCNDCCVVVHCWGAGKGSEVPLR